MTHSWTNNFHTFNSPLIRIWHRRPRCANLFRIFLFCFWHRIKFYDCFVINITGTVHTAHTPSDKCDIKSSLSVFYSSFDILRLENRNSVYIFLFFCSQFDIRNHLRSMHLCSHHTHSISVIGTCKQCESITYY